MTLAAFIGIALIHLAAVASPGPSFVVTVRTAAGEAPRMLLPAFRLGVLTQLANPKPALFYGAVFIGLVPPETSSLTLAALLALIFLRETLWFVMVARFFSLSGPRAACGSLKTCIDRIFGGLIALFGAKTALT